MVTSIEKLRGVSAVDGSTKAKIERAALILFADGDIDGVPTKDIAARAGVSEGAIYRHFKSKHDLARSLMVAIHSRLTEMIKVAAEREFGIKDQVEFIVRHYCQIADDDWALFKYHIFHLHYFKQLSKSPDDSPIGAAANLLKVAMFRDEIKNEDPYVLSAMALGTVLQTAQAKVFGYIDGPLTARADIFIQGVSALIGLEEEA